MSKKIKWTVLVFLVFLIISLIGVSFSYWRFESKQTAQNIASSKCFKVNITNESDAITLTNMHPITDEEGLKSSSYSFTIENTCDTYAMYQVNLEDILDDTITKRLNNKYIKISLNDGTPKALNTYQSVTPTINNADASFKLTSGSLSPKGSNNDSVNYNLKLWMNYDTPALDEVMSATFKSKISVVSVYTEEENLNNEITIAYTSKDIEYSNVSETVEIIGESKEKDIIEYSEDGSSYTSVDIPSKKVTLVKTYNKEITPHIYFKDEVGNIKDQAIELKYLDQTGPTISLNKSNEWGIANTIDITLKDDKSGLNGYALTNIETEPSEWTSVNGQEMNVTETVYNNGKYYIYAKDSLGNINHTSIDIDKIDDIAPVITSITEQSEYGLTSKITINAKDNETGLKRYGIRDPNNQITWTNFTGNPKEENIIFTAKSNGRYSIYVEDNGTSTASQYFNVTKVDMIKPTAKINANVLNDSITISATGSTDLQTGIAKYEYSIDGTTYYSSEEENYTFTGLNDGVYTAYLRVTDKAGLNTTVSTSAVVAYQNVYVSNLGDDSSGNGSKESPFASLNMAYVKVKSGGNINLLSDITPIMATYFDTENKDITLTSANTDERFIIHRSKDFISSPVITIKNKNVLNIRNVEFNGESVSSTATLLYSSNATLNLLEDTLLDSSITTTPSIGAAVHVDKGGYLNIYSGVVIENNKGNNTGAINVSGSVINLYGGTITRNEVVISTGGCGAGGVSVWEGTFNLKGGTISRNKGCWGGGIKVNGRDNDSIFNMSGGSIQMNESPLAGGGILLQNDGAGKAIGTITGGTISSNDATTGGGIYLDNATMNISNVTISDNNSTSTGTGGTTGGGIRIAGASILTMTSGEISGNYSATMGGGIGLFNKSKFYFKGGTIKNNTAKLNGGGIVYGDADTALYMQGGSVINNKSETANTYGGLYWGNNATYSYSSGTIRGNTPKDSNK